jgi:hypothetical protein
MAVHLTLHRAWLAGCFQFVQADSLHLCCVRTVPDCAAGVRIRF